MSDATEMPSTGAQPPVSAAPFGRRRLPLTPFPPSAGPFANPARPAISIVVPLRNEGDNVQPLARQILAALQGRDLELILVDDASIDDTWQQILDSQKLEPRIRALRHSRQSGQSAALWTGFSASRGSIIATLDGDRQNDPADLPRLVAELAAADLVCGVRTTRQDNGLRRISSTIARHARKMVLGVDFPDIGCNLRVMKRAVLQTLLPFDGVHRFLPVLALDAGAVVKQVPVAHHARVAGRSKYGVWNRLGRGLKDLLMLGWYRKRQLDNVQVVEHQPGKSGAPEGPV